MSAVVSLRHPSTIFESWRGGGGEVTGGQTAKFLDLIMLRIVMAKKTSTRRTKKRKAQIIPAETCLKYELPGDGSDVYVDLMRDISAVNRRLYNQGQVVQISHITIRQLEANKNLAVDATIKTLPITWVAAQAYMKARSAWMHQQKLVGSDYGHTAGGQERIRPKYEDFKVYMDPGQRTGTTLYTLDGAGAAVVQGEWDYSKLVYADQTVSPEVVREPYLHMIGDDVGTPKTDVGIINAYEDSRATVSPTQPNTPAAASTNIYALLSGGQDDGAAQEVIQNMENENDNPPYSLAHYPGGPVNYPTNVDRVYLRTSAANPIVNSGPFMAMCGLLRIYSQGKDVDTGEDTDVPAIMQVHLVPGNKKGLLTMNVGDLV